MGYIAFAAVFAIFWLVMAYLLPAIGIPPEGQLGVGGIIIIVLMLVLAAYAATRE